MLLGVAVEIGEQAQDAAGVAPPFPGAGLAHGGEFPQGEGIGIQAEATCELPDESPDICGPRTSAMA